MIEEARPFIAVRDEAAQRDKKLRKLMFGW
jgi:hypothetical protein